MHRKYYVIEIRAFLNWLNEEIQSRLSPKRLLVRLRDIMYFLKYWEEKCYFRIASTAHLFPSMRARAPKERYRMKFFIHCD